MKKDYTSWSPIKARIHNAAKRPVGFYKREIWICSIGENIGFEEDGKGERFVRPVLIMRNFGNRFCFTVPLSTTTKRGKYYHPFNADTGKTSVALLSQAKAVDAARLRRKIGMASKEDFAVIKKKLAEVLEL
ncbi:MAG: type II toxin-antitoxin system PemK/MazF family toxin [Clostridiales bacterium]|nr:type II toxin-antitoxin system PemK/MazF family toxin [Clostridiales bacterium]